MFSTYIQMCSEVRHTNFENIQCNQRYGLNLPTVYTSNHAARRSLKPKIQESLNQATLGYSREYVARISVLIKQSSIQPFQSTHIKDD